MVKHGNASACKKRFILVSFILALSAVLGAPVAAQAQSASSTPPALDALRIEQVQAELPNLRVWAYADHVPEAQGIRITLGGQALETLATRTIDPAQDATAWYFLVDCSTSTTAAQMQAVREVLEAFPAQMGAKDTVSLITFGTQVDVLLRHESDSATLATAAQSLQATQPGTLFFDALAACAEVAGQGAPLQREVVFVFSDSVDYNLGGYTQTEVDALLAENNLPVYAFGFDSGAKEQLDNFGAVARTSGGAISIVNAQNLPQAFAAQVDAVQSAVLIEAQAPSNRIISPLQTLELTAGPNTIQCQAALRYWVPDNTAPTITSAAQASPESIQLRFSEAVQGAASTEAYEIVRENGDLAGISAAAYSEEDHTVLLTLSSVVSSGPLHILCPGVQDVSMEENPVAGETTLEFEGNAPQAAPPEAAPEQNSPFGLWLLLTLAGVAIIAGIALAVVKKRGGFVVKGNKLHYANEIVLEKELENAPGAQVHFVQANRPAQQITLKVSAAGGAARTVTVQVDKTLFVGRSDVCDLMFDDSAMSRQHFVIGEEAGAFSITNLSESGGTRLNGISLQKPRSLHRGDVIEAGSTKIIFYPTEPGSPILQ